MIFSFGFKQDDYQWLFLWKDGAGLVFSKFFWFLFLSPIFDNYGYFANEFLFLRYSCVPADGSALKKLNWPILLVKKRHVLTRSDLTISTMHQSGQTPNQKPDNYERPPKDCYQNVWEKSNEIEFHSLYWQKEAFWKHSRCYRCSATGNPGDRVLTRNVYMRISLLQID